MLVPLLAVFLLCFLGGIRLTVLAQNRVALQSRLDICAIERAVKRKNALQRIVELNQALDKSAKAIYAARAAVLTGVGAAAGAAALPALLAVNQTAHRAQQALVYALTAKEAAASLCQPTQHSAERAGCLVTPLLASALAEKHALFPDVSEGVWQKAHSGEELAAVRCQALKRLKTKIVVLGQSGLLDHQFRDRYEE